MNTELQRQLSVAIENQPGRLAQISRLLADQGVSIVALCVIDNVEQGMVRMVTSDAAKARTALEAATFHVVEAEILAVASRDRLGQLAAISEALGNAGVNIEYAYATVDHEGAKTRILLKTSKARKAQEVLAALQDV